MACWAAKDEDHDQAFPSPSRAGHRGRHAAVHAVGLDRKSTRLNSNHQIISYAVFCLKKTNGSTTGLKSSPFLTNEIPTHSASATYEEAERSQSASRVNGFYIDVDGRNTFATILWKHV